MMTQIRSISNSACFAILLCLSLTASLANETDSQSSIIIYKPEKGEAHIPEVEPQTSQYYYDSGKAKQKSGKYKEALSDFKSALQLNLREPQTKESKLARFHINKNIAMTYGNLGAYKSAEFYVFKATFDKKSPAKGRADLTFWMAEICNKRGNTSRALKYYKQTIQANPQFEKSDYVNQKIKEISRAPSCGMQRLRTTKEMIESMKSKTKVEEVEKYMRH